MRVLLRLVLCAVLAGMSLAAAAQTVQDPAPLQFEDPAEADRFHALVSELRCVMCQNQSLADSNAQIAHDLRREVLDLMRQGRDDEAIRGYLVDRYGEFVLYRPRVGATTWLLWFGPLVLLVGGGVLVASIVRRRAAALPPTTDEPQEW